MVVGCLGDHLPAIHHADVVDLAWGVGGVVWLGLVLVDPGSRSLTLVTMAIPPITTAMPSPVTHLPLLSRLRKLWKIYASTDNGQ